MYYILYVHMLNILNKGKNNCQNRAKLIVKTVPKHITEPVAKMIAKNRAGRIPSEVYIYH